MRHGGISALLIAFFLVWGLMFAGVAHGDGTILVGASSADVNPPPGICMGGYNRNRLTTGVHDNLYAKAVVFDDGKTPVALVVVDSVGIPYADVRKIRTEASSRVKAIVLPSGDQTGFLAPLM